ncbi:F-box/kelch-repeat protein At3g06240-like [Rutidosis leptorrhynchoides]|uniref:F-box/kelch-repeat protein At3g06240-like n=1 Tax=Rutidosis leptorrhynchoides TaxID=125765 RepID=UPI003A9A03A2
MADVHIHDDITNNILTRLPGKSLIRFRCVSKHWNRLISDPYFMKSRSRRMILLKHPMPFVVLDTKDHSIMKIPNSLLEERECKEVSIVGTHNGIVVLVTTDFSLRTHIYLYNPLTRASKLLDVMDRPSPELSLLYEFGIGYGATTEDLKIVRFGCFSVSDLPRLTCHVYDFKTSSWARSTLPFNDYFFFWDAGIFLNGYIYWFISLTCVGIIALNVKEMVFSIINLPNGKDPRGIYHYLDSYVGTVLGSLNGCLCMIDKKDTGFELWVMKEDKKNSWSNERSFTFGLDWNYLKKFHPVCILVDDRILLTDGYNQFVMYDTSKDSYVTISHNLINPDFDIRLITLSDFKRIRCVEYVESLVSPSDICAL